MTECGESKVEKNMEGNLHQLMITFGHRKAGATDNGKPGERSYTKGYYAAYVLDFEGNNIECVYYQPWWLSVIQLAPLTLGGIFLGCVAWYAGRAGWSL
jgi:hypothetical protein